MGYSGRWSGKVRFIIRMTIKNSPAWKWLMKQSKRRKAVYSYSPFDLCEFLPSTQSLSVKMTRVWLLNPCFAESNLCSCCPLLSGSTEKRNTLFLEKKFEKLEEKKISAGPWRLSTISHFLESTNNNSFSETFQVFFLSSFLLPESDWSRW